MSMHNKEINIIVRVMPNADDIEVSLPLQATARDIIESLLDSGLGIPKVDNQGNPISYEIVPKGNPNIMKETQTILDAKVQETDVLLMLPKIIAG